MSSPGCCHNFGHFANFDLLFIFTTVEDDIIINKLDKKVSILNNFSGIPDNWKSSFPRISWNTCTI